MFDESGLQVGPTAGKSSLSEWKMRSGLIGRGRRDATALARLTLEATDPFYQLRQQAEAGDTNAQVRCGDKYLSSIPECLACSLYRLRGTTVKEMLNVEPCEHDDGDRSRFDEYGREAAVWYRKAADQGYAIAQHKLGACYRHGIGVPQNSAEAFEWWREAANQGYAEAQYALGRGSFWGDGAPHDYSEGVRWYRKAADQGHAGAQYALGRAFHEGTGVQQDYGEAAHWYRKAAEQPHRSEDSYDEAALYLGFLYLDGRGVPKDYVEAAKWLRQSIPSEFGIAELCLGQCYFYGRGVQRDYGEAARWLLKALQTDVAANGGETYDEIGYLLSFVWSRDEVAKQWRSIAEGEDGWQKYAEDAKWHRKQAGSSAAQPQRVPAHQFCLGLAYAYGLGLSRDYTEAAMWFRRAADAGETWAQFHLAVAHAKGRGVPQDYLQAHMWFNVAASRTIGDPQEYVSAAREEVARRMTPQQISEAQRLAREWKPTDTKDS